MDDTTRRHFLRTTGATTLGAYALVNSVAPTAARAAVSEAPGVPTTVVRFNEAALQAIRETHPGPPIVARSLAVMHTCMYDAWAAYDADAVGTQTGGALRRPESERTDDNKRRGFSYAGYRALRDLFPAPAQQVAFDALMGSLGYDPTDASTDPTTPTGVGNTAAKAVLDFRHGDGSNQAGGYADTSGYQPVNTPDELSDPDRWQPLLVPDGHGGTVTQRFIAPHWGGVTPFALTSYDQFGVDDPASYRSDRDRYWLQSAEVLGYSATLNDRRKVIAEYWADGPSSELPPGHWGLFAAYVSGRDDHSEDEDVKMFFALTNAILDASIACWGAKRRYDSVRPVSSIHYLFADRKVLAWAGPGQGTRWIYGRDWRPYQAATVVTPPFAEYYSGHSTFSAAGAEVLRRFTGSDAFGASYVNPAGQSRFEPGLTPHDDVTLRWRTFSAAADEAGVSRRYGGIHFRQGDLAGREVGRLVGKQAWKRAQRYIGGV